ncbi:hypothetical protein BKH20_09420 [Actinomyces oris]|uniref:Uncharacterized protein n=1 Tax=Actinomyces oris TaxID=544580 RepID=A0A1Q8WMB6_9ACTO|nr:hypothetical protein [Actinomyces oris]OLO68394.1 hypothetical protein BKH20_09420 [Actinomyces oris]
MRQTSTPKRFLALALSAGILTTGLALSSTTASAAEPAAVTASAPQARSTDDAAPTGWFDRFKQDWRKAARRYNEADQRAARNFR